MQFFVFFLKVYLLILRVFPSNDVPVPWGHLSERDEAGGYLRYCKRSRRLGIGYATRSASLPFIKQVLNMPNIFVFSVVYVLASNKFGSVRKALSTPETNRPTLRRARLLRLKNETLAVLCAY